MLEGIPAVGTSGSSWCVFPTDYGLDRRRAGGISDAGRGWPVRVRHHRLVGRLARLLFVWVVFLGFAVAIRHRGNIGSRAAGRRYASIARIVICARTLQCWRFNVLHRGRRLRCASRCCRLPVLQITIAWLTRGAGGSVMMTGGEHATRAAGSPMPTPRARRLGTGRVTPVMTLTILVVRSLLVLLGLPIRFRDGDLFASPCSIRATPLNLITGP